MAVQQVLLRYCNEPGSLLKLHASHSYLAEEKKTKRYRRKNQKLLKVTLLGRTRFKNHHTPLNHNENF